VNAVLQRPLPYKEHNRLVVGWEANSEQGVDRLAMLCRQHFSNSIQPGIRFAAIRASKSFPRKSSREPARFDPAKRPEECGAREIKVALLIISSVWRTDCRRQLHESALSKLVQ
jgi:hypothetical protein